MLAYSDTFNGYVTLNAGSSHISNILCAIFSMMLQAILRISGYKISIVSITISSHFSLRKVAIGV